MRQANGRECQFSACSLPFFFYYCCCNIEIRKEIESFLFSHSCCISSSTISYPYQIGCCFDTSPSILSHVLLGGHLNTNIISFDWDIIGLAVKFSTIATLKPFVLSSLQHILMYVMSNGYYFLFELVRTFPCIK